MNTPAPGVSAPKIPVAPVPFIYNGTKSRLSGLWYSILLLRIVTLGIYSPWGKTRLRQYVAQQYSIDNTPLVYTGTGGELFRGMILAGILLIPLFILMQYVAAKQNSFIFVLYLFFIFLFYAGRYLALRYRLSRTTWMGIRLTLGGSVMDYLVLRAKWFAINVVTLGYTIPHADMAIREYILQRTTFGQFPILFRSNIQAVMPIHLKTWLLFIPTLGLSRLWYKAELLRVTARSMRIGQGVYVRTDVTGIGLLKLMLGNLLIVLCSLGFLIPWALQRNYVFLARHLSFSRRTDTQLDDATQSTTPATKRTEGLDALIGDGGLAF